MLAFANWSMKSDTLQALVPLRERSPALCAMDVRKFRLWMNKTGKRGLKPVGDVWMRSNPDTNQSARVQAVLRFLNECFARDRADWFS